MMKKTYSIACIHRADRTCTNVAQPHGARPSPGVCAKMCRLYEGPAPIETFEPLPIPDDYKPTPANATKGGCGCDPINLSTKENL